MLFDQNLLGRERLLEHVDSRSRIGRPAHKDVECGIAVLGPTVDRDVRFGENRDTRYTPVRGGVVKVDMQQRGASDLDATSKRLLDVL